MSQTPRHLLVVAAGYRLGALGFKTGDGGEGHAGRRVESRAEGPEDRRGLGGEMGRGVWRRGRRNAHGY